MPATPLKATRQKRGKKNPKPSCESAHIAKDLGNLRLSYIFLFFVRDIHGIYQARHPAFSFSFGNTIVHSSAKLVRESGSQNEG